MNGTEPKTCEESCSAAKIVLVYSRHTQTWLFMYSCDCTAHTETHSYIYGASVGLWELPLTIPPNKAQHNTYSSRSFQTCVIPQLIAQWSHKPIAIAYSRRSQSQMRSPHALYILSFPQDKGIFTPISYSLSVLVQISSWDLEFVQQLQSAF